MSTNVCGLRSTSGNQLDCTCTMMRWPLRKVWQHVLQRELHRRRLARLERLGLLETVAELAAHHVAAHELLIAAHAARRSDSDFGSG